VSKLRSSDILTILNADDSEIDNSLSGDEIDDFPHEELDNPRVRMYWEKDTRVPPVVDNMTKDRFFSIRSNIHFIDNMTIPPGNKDVFIKVRPLYDTIKKKCNSLPMERNICIDEQMVPFKGHLSIKQYIRNKSNPWGIKILVPFK
jgi:hypothetical protein